MSCSAWLLDERMNKGFKQSWIQPHSCHSFPFLFLSFGTFLTSFHPSFFPHQLPFSGLPPSLANPPPPSLQPPPSLLRQGSCGLSERQTNEDPRRAAPAPLHITHSLSLNHYTHTHTYRTDPPLSHTGSASGCHGNPRKVSLSRPDCVELRQDGGAASLAPALLCHTEPRHARLVSYVADLTILLSSSASSSRRFFALNIPCSML